MRLDAYLVKNNIAGGRDRAKEMIAGSQIKVNDRTIVKPAFDVGDNDRVEVVGEVLRYVSRGGLKLEKAITDFSLDLKGKICMDIGASTGGFTDCMLQNGAELVYAIDVGTGQLAEKLIKDPRVKNREHTNARELRAEDFDILPDFASCDVSFISLTKILPAIYRSLGEGGQAVCLIKPQFEAGPKNLNKKGVVKDKKVRDKVVEDIKTFAGDSGFKNIRITQSPITGPEGNIEFLMFVEK